MSKIIRKTSFISGSLLSLVVLCSCAQPVTEYGVVTYTNPYNQPQYNNAPQPFVQSYYQDAYTVPTEQYVQTQGAYAVSPDSKWGPICPMDGTDLSYLEVGNNVAISTPIIDNGVDGFAYPPCGGQPMIAQQSVQMPMPIPAPVQQQVPQAYAPAQQFVVSQPVPMPVQPQPQPKPPVHHQMSQNSGNVLPVKGVIGGANEKGYLFMECSGTYISTESTCVNNQPVQQSVPQMVAPQPVPMPVPTQPQASVQTETVTSQVAQTQVVEQTVIGRDWVATEGESLRTLLEQWGNEAGWKVVWNSDREYVIEAGAVFRGQFMDVSSALIRAFARANPAPQGTFYKGNKVLVINTQEAENAE